jgi:hypothetical protein
MKTPRRLLSNLAIAAVYVTVVTTMSTGLTSPSGIQVPIDAQPTCVVSAPTFAGWFQSGTVTPNGIVKPANSVTFPNVPNCSFYQWSQQMFLWVTSPAPAIYGPGAHVFDSSTFYDVSPPDASGNRTFLPHAPGRIRFFPMRAAKVDAHGLQLIFDRAGHPLEVIPPALGPTGKPLILNTAGTRVEVQRVTLAANGKPVFLDKAGKVITGARPLLQLAPELQRRALVRPQFIQPIAVQKFIINGRPIFLNSAGNVVQVEQGQADGSVLEAQNGSLIYYATIANDVYAYFLTGQKDGAFSATQFPTTAANLSQITTFASAHGKTFPDPNALAVELKTSWIETTGLSNLSSYITTTGTIPTYDKSNPNSWVQNGTKTVKLALLGMHVVGSASGHPEMIWSTFEHSDNSPNAAYTYNSTSGPKTVAQNTSGMWVFCCANSSGPFDQAHMSQGSGSTIVPNAPFTISPSDTIRWKAWGMASNTSPAASNTDVISIDHTISTLLASGDIRSNYIMTGATWTIGGAAPNSGNQVGTNQLQNTTLETYEQGTSTTNTGSINCFVCHTSNQTAVSHVYPGLKPLF